MNKIYKISLYVNIIVSAIFLALMVIAIFGALDSSITSELILVCLLIFICYIFSLAFDISCIYINKLNQKNIIAINWFKKYFVLLTIINIVSILFSLFIVTAASTALIINEAKLPARQIPYYVISILLIIIGSVSSIFNQIYFYKIKKQNQQLVNNLVNDIGFNK